MVETTKVLLFKKEAVYGTDAVPTGAANARLTRNFKRQPVVTDRLDRKLDRPVRGGSKDAPTNLRQTISYELELAGSGVVDTPAPWMEELQCCGMASPVITAGTKVAIAFAAIGAALSAGSAYHWTGNQKFIGLGGRGTFGFDFTAGQYPFLKLDFTLLLPAGTSGVDAASPAITLDQWKDPVEVNTANTTFTLDGYAAVLRSFTGDVNAEVKLRNLVGANYVQRGNHAITGKLMIEAPALASKNYFQTLKVGTEVAVDILHGTVVGNIVHCAGSHLQITSIDEDEEDGVSMWSIGYRMNAGTTPDDLIFESK